jgi:hypothetical protein
VLLVVGMRLGCLNHALLSEHALRARGVELAGWVANVVDPACRCGTRISLRSFAASPRRASQSSSTTAPFCSPTNGSGAANRANILRLCSTRAVANSPRSIDAGRRPSAASRRTRVLRGRSLEPVAARTRSLADLRGAGDVQPAAGERVRRQRERGRSCRIRCSSSRCSPFAFRYIERRATSWERLTVSGDRVIVERGAKAQ